MSSAGVNLLTRFPPSFEDNPWTYGFALFSTVLLSALCLAQLLAYGLDARRAREVSRLVDNPVLAAPTPFWSAVSVYRLTLSGLLLTLLMRAVPDAAVMLAWGETSDATMVTLFAVDRYCDGAAIFPFLGSAYLWAWSRQSIPQRLAEVVRTPLPPPNWAMVRDWLKVSSVVFLIAVGVTLAKAWP